MAGARTPWAAAALLAGGLLVMGCAGSRPPAARPAPEREPWVVPAGDYGTQRLFRLHYEGPDGEGTLRLVLRLESPRRYRLVISDRFGRSLFTLDAAPGGGYLLDHRQHLACPLNAGVRLEGLPIDPLPLDALPAVLLGRLPAAPGHGLPRPSSSGELELRDAAGRRWTAQLGDGDRVRSWTLWRAGEPALWWRTESGQALLSDRERGAQASWREVGREPLPEPLPPPAVPEGYAAGACEAPAPASAVDGVPPPPRSPV